MCAITHEPDREKQREMYFLNLKEGFFGFSGFVVGTEAFPCTLKGVFAFFSEHTDNTQTCIFSLNYIPLSFGNGSVNGKISASRWRDILYRLHPFFITLRPHSWEYKNNDAIHQTCSYPSPLAITHTPSYRCYCELNQWVPQLQPHNSVLSWGMYCTTRLPMMMLEERP